LDKRFVSSFMWSVFCIPDPVSWTWANTINITQNSHLLKTNWKHTQFSFQQNPESTQMWMLLLYTHLHQYHFLLWAIIIRYKIQIFSYFIPYKKNDIMKNVKWHHEECFMNCLPFVCYKVNYFTMYTEYSLYNDEPFAVSKIISTCIWHECTGLSSSISYTCK
jgi:hypothetical protein